MVGAIMRRLVQRRMRRERNATPTASGAILKAFAGTAQRTPKMAVWERVRDHGLRPFGSPEAHQALSRPAPP